MPAHAGSSSCTRRTPAHNLPEEVFEAQVTKEVEDLLLAMRAERQLNRLSTNPQLQRILTKEDCMTLFRATGVPPPSALWGVYRWAADLGWAHANFELDDSGNYDFLDAYD